MKLKKIIIFVIVIILIVQTTTFATIDTSQFNPGEPTGSDAGKIIPLAGKIIGVIQTIGIIVSIIGAIVIGIKYMLGSVEEKAEYKKTMWPYLVGCIFIFSISTIVSLIYNFVKQL